VRCCREVASARILCQHGVLLRVSVLYPPSQTVCVTRHSADVINTVKESDNLRRASTQQTVDHADGPTTGIANSDVNDPLQTIVGPRVTVVSICAPPRSVCDGIVKRRVSLLFLHAQSKCCVSHLEVCSALFPGLQHKAGQHVPIEGSPSLPHICKNN
jgi:hypothetical protein